MIEVGGICSKRCQTSQSSHYFLMGCWALKPRCEHTIVMYFRTMNPRAAAKITLLTLVIRFKVTNGILQYFSVWIESAFRNVVIACACSTSYFYDSTTTFECIFHSLYYRKLTFNSQCYAWPKRRNHADWDDVN